MAAGDSKIRVAIVGLGFGAEFIPIYQNHPHAEMYAICQRSQDRLDQLGDAFGVGVRYSKFADVLADPNVEAIHINTPIPDHAPQSLAALKAGKHVACTVPMATTLEECRDLVAAQRATGKRYMMMETVVYSREAALRARRAGADPILARLALAGNGRLARLLGGPAADALCHALRQPLSVPPGQAG
jgi:predicted dehydrogenase